MHIWGIRVGNYCDSPKLIKMLSEYGQCLLDKLQGEIVPTLQNPQCQDSEAEICKERSQSKNSTTWGYWHLIYWQVMHLQNL